MNQQFRGGGGSTTTLKELPFLLSGEVEFGPFYPPTRIQIAKERELNRKSSMCGGEDVTDEGSKNREIHVAGEIRKSEIQAFNSLLDNDEPLNLIVPGFTGEVHVRQGDLEGPNRYDPRNQEYLFEYSIDLVSTGREEDGSDNGIISEGSGSSGGSSGTGSSANGSLSRR